MRRTIAAATSRGQPALTAEYKLKFVVACGRDRLICRARVIKPGRQVAVVAADVFCLMDGVEKHNRNRIGVDCDAHRAARCFIGPSFRNTAREMAAFAPNTGTIVPQPRRCAVGLQ